MGDQLWVARSTKRNWIRLQRRDGISKSPFGDRRLVWDFAHRAFARRVADRAANELKVRLEGSKKSTLPSCRQQLRRLVIDGDTLHSWVNEKSCTDFLRAKLIQ